MSDYDSGLVVLVGQIVDAFAQPVIGYSSDVTESRFGKRMPWYLFGHLCALPCFFFIFNPPDWALGENLNSPVGWTTYFLVVPSIMNIG